ncbi:MAG: efflux RND transporter periplasmic adaptor subunit [Gemmatimonadetes bacterium]|nr:efflux RND transporter periplasmic adaptor subunit [Gemmatimonadota bacterium]
MSRSSRALSIVGAGALVLVAAACGGTEAADAAADTPVTVQVGPEAITIAERTMLSSGPILSGTLVAERTAQIRAEVPGAVVRVFHDPGARVEQGTSLAKIDDRAINDAYLSARSGLTAAQTAAEIAKRELERSEKLIAVGAIADRDLENARRGDLTARTMLDDARARLAAAQKQLDATNVLAPYAGVVSERMVNAGDIVAPGTPLFSIVDPATMRLEAAVPAEQLSEVRTGSPVRFTVTGYPGRTFQGRISSVNPSADPQTRQVRLFVRIPNAGNQLVAGLFAEGRVASDSRETLTAPQAAVDVRGLVPTVLRLRNGRTEKVEVTLGARDESTERVELLSGVTAGDTLLVGAALGISPNTPLKVSTPADKPARN